LRKTLSGQEKRIVNLAEALVLAATAELTKRLADGGPVYTETNTQQPIVEPWNAASALLFLLLVGWWTVRLWGRYRRFPFLTCCLPLLAAGGVGGTFYHAFRVSAVFFWLDILPIYLLGAAASLYFCFRLRMARWRIALVILVTLVLQATLVPVLSRVSPENPHLAINGSYVLLAALLLLPLALLLRKTAFRHWGWIALGLALFFVALFFRAVDTRAPPLLPMGTHWLWHVFGAGTVTALTEYVYQLATDAPSASAD
jgi:predicted membrane channel-forming protein YqfA (hemolysin III family)